MMKNVDSAVQSIGAALHPTHLLKDRFFGVSYSRGLEASAQVERG